MNRWPRSRKGQQGVGIEDIFSLSFVLSFFFNSAEVKLWINLKTHRIKSAKLWPCATFASTAVARVDRQAKCKLDWRSSTIKLPRSDETRIIAGAKFCLANDALSLGPWCSFETDEQNRKSPNLQGRDFSCSFGSHKLLHFNLNLYMLSKTANKVLEKRQLRGSMPNFKTKALAVWKLKGKENCEDEHRETASFVCNFVQKINATKQLWLHFLPTSPLNFFTQFSPEDPF